jgi:hypothetical protein
MESKNDIMIREYQEKDYTCLVSSGYPFSSYLKPDFYNRLKNLFKVKEIGKFVLKTFFLNQEELLLVAYSTEARKAVGVVTLRKITENLWGMWDIFVSPEFRGRRIASLLYEQAFEFLRKRKVPKAVGSITLVPDRLASLKSVKRNWPGYLSTRVFECRTNEEPEKYESDQITVRKFRRGEEKTLFEIFEHCTGEEWCSRLEIDQNNFLDRIFGYVYFEAFSKNLLKRIAIKRNILVAEYNGETQGYAISRMVRLIISEYNLHLFVPPSENFSELSKALLSAAFDPSVYKRKKKVTFIYLGNKEMQAQLRELGFEVVERLIPYIHL